MIRFGKRWENKKSRPLSTITGKGERDLKYR